MAHKIKIKLVICFTPFFILLSFIAVCGACYADIPTGGNISQEARAGIEKLKPGSTFETQKLPGEPDYSLNSSWAALPGVKDTADLAPVNTKYPEAQGSASADVFFIHPTTAVSSSDNWNIPIDDPVEVKDLDGIMIYSAGAFNAAAKVYVPRYREAALYSFFDDKTYSGIKAVELAYRDVERAFLYYISHYNDGRPFILAGHSQGSIHALRLLQEHVIGTPLKDRMVAAYLVGGAIPQDVPGIEPSRSATDTGVIIGWNTYTEQGDSSIFTDGLIAWIGTSYTALAGRRLLETNPLSWELNGREVTQEYNPGSMPYPHDAITSPELVAGVCGADASGDVLIINKPRAEGFTLPAAFSMLLFNDRYGDYHCFDYQLFYESIRANAVERVKSFMVSKK